MINLLLIGSVIVSIDGYQVNQCQYRSPNTGTIITWATKPEFKCPRVLKL